MNEPKRWLRDGDAPSAARDLLQAVRCPEVPSTAKQLELVQHLASLAPTATAISAAATTAGSVWLKLGVVTAVGAAGVWGAVSLSGAGSAPSSPTSPPPAVAVPVKPPVPREAAASAPIFTPSPVADAVSPQPTVKRTSARDLLADEELLLEQARRKVSSSPNAALALLQQYQRRFPAGQLTAERMFLSVEVLNRLGRSTAAQTQADALIRRFPNSVYATQLRARRAP